MQPGGTIKPVRRKMLIPLAVVLLFLVVGFVCVLAAMQQNRLNQSCKYILENVSGEFAESLTEQSEALSAIGQVIVRDASMHSSLKDHDRDRLLADHEAVFTKLLKNYGITHLYFHGTDRVNLLRVHKPEKHGDLIDRFTMLEAARTGRISSGIELGSLGTFMLRNVHPIFSGRVVIGYIELGKEIEEIFTGIHKRYGTELAVSIRKSAIDRAQWETGMAMLGREAVWDRFSSSVLIYKSLPRFPTECEYFIDAPKRLSNNVNNEIEFDDRSWRIMASPLKDVSGAEVGDLIIFADISGARATFYKITAAMLGQALVLLVALLGFFYVILGRIDRSILAQHKALVRGNKKYRILADNLPDVVWTRDLNLECTYISPSVEKQSGFSVEEKMKQPLGLSMKLDSMEVATKILSEELVKEQEGTGESDRSRTFELEMYRKDGSVYPVEATVSFLRDSNGKAVELLGVNRDITERKKAEDELKATNQWLEETTVRANEMAAKAEVANIAKSEFLANMSHEIRTPMNGVIGMTSLLMDSDLNEEQREYAEILNDSGESLLTLINDILDLSKIEAGKLEFEAIDFHFRNTLETVADFLSIKADEKNIEFVCFVFPDFPSFLKGDPGRLRQVIMNIAGNAIKFTEEGEVTVSGECEKEAGNGVLLKIRISDTGIGIPKNRIKDLFMPFTQVDGSITRKYGGSGLGLSISKQLVENMGGEIGVESTEGKGSTFWFTVRFEKAETIEYTEPVFADFDNINVLVVDDNAANRFLVTQYLKTWGCRYSQAEDAEKAFQMLNDAAKKDDPFQVAVLDMAMPDEDGESLGRRIKDDNRITGTSLVLMTSIGGKKDAKRFSQIGFSSFLTKPVHYQMLHDAIAFSLGRKEPLETQKADPHIKQYAIPEEERKTHTRILLVEDNKNSQYVAKSMLNKLGYSCEVAVNGQEAIENLAKTPCDLVLMDCQMPVMDGYETTRQIRTQQSGILNSDIPIIALTASAMQDDWKKCLEAGMNDYLSKPIKPKDLAEKLNEWLPKGRKKNESINC